ncbi:MAG TPA: PHB depolymerase family esterase [Polyangia bacterium]|jgi:poly(3-hydroxybutyrate) depolymerase
MTDARRWRRTALAVALAIVAGGASGITDGKSPPAVAPTGYLTKSFSGPPGDPVQHQYALLVPRSYTPDRPWPLLLALHGAFSNHVENLQRVLGGKDLQSSQVDAPMLVLSPLGGGELMAYDGLGEEDVLGALAAVRRDYNVDADRIYLTGLSMGGGGTWTIGLHHPDLFAALVVVCGVVDPRQWIPEADRALYDLPAMERAIPTAIAENAVNQRVFIYHGDADPVVPVSDARQMVERFRSLGWLNKSVSYFELPGVAHNAWDIAYHGDNVFHLLADVRRDPFPEHVWFKTASLHYQNAYWARIDRIDSGTALAELDARQHDGAFVVRLANASGFSLLLPAAAIAPAKVVTVQVQDGPGGNGGTLVFNGPAGEGAFSFARDGGHWHRVAAPVSGAPPAHAAVGLASRSLPRQGLHVYVYGTDCPPATMQAAKHLADALADWGPGVRARFTVVADRDVTAQMRRQFHLVLIGDRKINRLTRELAARAPLPVAADAAQGDRSYRLVVQNALFPGKHALIFGAQSPTALGHLWRFARHNKDAWAPAPNLDYIQFNAAGTVEETRY